MNRAASIRLLDLDTEGEGRYLLPLPDGSQEGGNVVYGGQLLAQTIMASAAEHPDGFYIKALNTVFHRAGSFDAPIHAVVETPHAGRTFASQVITVWQGERHLTTSLVLATSDEPDLVAHQIDAPSRVPHPEVCPPAGGIVFPDADVRSASHPDDQANGVPTMSFWTRMPSPLESLPASQAVLAWATNGWLIELNMRPHREAVRIEDAHVTLSTGVVGQTIHFHRPFDAGSWLLLTHEATFAGKGRVHGRGAAFTVGGTLVATFAQDSMVKPGGQGPQSRL